MYGFRDMKGARGCVDECDRVGLTAVPGIRKQTAVVGRYMGEQFDIKVQDQLLVPDPIQAIAPSID